MTLQISTLRPGFLVSLKTSIRGSVEYEREVIEPEHMEDGKAKEKTQVERTIHDPVEHEASVKARGKARSIITRVCAISTNHGLLCPKSRREALDEAIKEARGIAEEFNKTARFATISIGVMIGEIANNDVEAMREINGEVRDLLSAMENGVKNLDPVAIREAANTAKKLGSMLTPDAEVRMQFAIDAARGAARKIVKAGEQAGQEIDKTVLRRIVEARTAFLDMDDVGQVAAPQENGRALDLAPSETVNVPRVRRAELDLA